MNRLSIAVSFLVVLHAGCVSPEVQPPAGSGGSASGSGGNTASGSGGNSADGTGGDPGSGGSPGSGGNSGSGGAAVNPLGRARCAPPPGMTGSPQTIQDTVALVNALPKPTSVACFVESLDRPLGAYATNSMFSLQPAVSQASPRVFLKVGRMWLSIVIDGDGKDLLEFGELLDDGRRSLKAEMQFPTTDQVAPGVPFDRVLYGAGGTVCGVCHREEYLDHMEGTSQVFSSEAFRPEPATRVPLDFLRGQAQSCDWQAQPQRCDLLSAVFGGGDVVDAEFPKTMGTFLMSSLPSSSLLNPATGVVSTHP